MALPEVHANKTERFVTEQEKSQSKSVKRTEAVVRPSTRVSSKEG